MIKLKSLLSETINTNAERIGFDPDEERSDMTIDWDKSDTQMGTSWNASVLRQFMGLSSKFLAIYQSIMEVSELDYNLAEDDLDIPEDERGGYDWDEYRMFARRGFPPIVVVREENGNIHLADGNHRLKWATDVGYKTIGAWVVDKFLQKYMKEKE